VPPVDPSRELRSYGVRGAPAGWLSDETPYWVSWGDKGWMMEFEDGTTSAHLRGRSEFAHARGPSGGTAAGLKPVQKSLRSLEIAGVLVSVRGW